MSPQPSNFQETQEGVAAGVAVVDTSVPIDSDDSLIIVPTSPSILSDEEISESDESFTPVLEENDKSITSTTGLLTSDILSTIVLESRLDQDEKNIKIHIDDEIPSKPSEVFMPSQIRPQVMAAIAVSLGSMIIGFGSGYTSTALPSMTAEHNSTIIIDRDGHEASWIGSLLPLGALVGGIAGGSLIEILGRKTTILATSVPFILSWLLIALANNIYMIYIARAIAGFCVGIASLSLPVYLAETVQPEVRGTLGVLPSTLGNSGILICFFAGSYLHWDTLAYLGAILSVPFLVAMMYIPETPRWYIAKGKEEEAQKALQWLRGAGSDIRTELNEIKNSHLLSTKYAIKMKDLLGKTYLKPLLTSLGLMFFQQFSGINAVIFYTVSIFEMSGSSVDSNVSTIIVGFVNIGATIGAILLIDRLGRKTLLLISDGLMIVCLSSLGTFLYFKEYSPESIEGFGWIPLVAFMLFVVAFSLGFGPIPWVMMGEIFPGRIRGSAAATATAFNWTCTFIVTKSFPEYLAAFGGHVTFFSFATVCLVGLFFVIFCVPETQGKSLEDIERKLTRPFRRISSTANLKPLPMAM